MPKYQTRCCTREASTFCSFYAHSGDAAIGARRHAHSKVHTPQCDDAAKRGKPVCDKRRATAVEARFGPTNSNAGRSASFTLALPWIQYSRYAYWCRLGVAVAALVPGFLLNL